MRVSDAAQRSIAAATLRHSYSIASHAGMLELEGMLQDDRLNDHDRPALAASAAQRISNPAFGSEIVHGPERCQGSLMKPFGNISLVWSFQT
jgi:hypothetical protein